MLLAMFTWCCASFRSFFAMDLKKQGWHGQSCDLNRRLAAFEPSLGR